MHPRVPCCPVGPTQTVVCPTKCNQVHTCSQSNVNYIHPAHTAVMNKHIIQNRHYYPQTTSWHNTVQSVNLYGGPVAPPPARPRW